MLPRELLPKLISCLFQNSKENEQTTPKPANKTVSEDETKELIHEECKDKVPGMTAMPEAHH